MPAKKSVQKRQKKAAGKGRSIPVPGKLESQKIAPKQEVPRSAKISTAPVLSSDETPAEIAVPTLHRTRPRIMKEHAVKHIKVLQAKSTAAAVTVGRGYNRADAAVVRTAKKAVPANARQRLNDNRAANNSNLQFYVPLAPKIIPHKVKVVVPAKIRRIRHAALPVALIAVLVFTMFPAGASPGYGSTNRMGGSGADQARKITVDDSGNTYTVGNFNGTVSFAESWGGASTTELHSDTYDTGSLSGWDTTSNIAASTDELVSGSYSAKSESINSASYAVKNITPTSDLFVESYVNVGSTSEDVDFFVVGNGTNLFTVYRQSPTDAICIYNGYVSATSACTSGDILPDNSWKKIGLRITAGNPGLMEVFVDDAPVIEDTVSNLGTDPYTSVTIGNTLNRTGLFYFDDTSVTSYVDTSGAKTSAGSQDIFVTKTNANGTYGWTKRIGGAGVDTGYDIAVNSEGEAYVVGTVTGTVDFAADWGGSDSKGSASGGDAFLTKIAADGSYGATWKFAGSGGSEAKAVEIADDDSVYVGGEFAETIIFDTDFGSSGDSKTSVSNTLDTFVTKIAANDTYAWTKRIGNYDYDNLSDIAVNKADNRLYIVGTFLGIVDFAADWGGAADEKSSLGFSYADMYLTSIEGDGSYGWTKIVSGEDDETPNAIEVSPDGSVYVGGYFNSPLLDFAADWGGTDTKSYGSFITRINNDDSYGWTKTVGSESAEVVNEIATDAANNIYIGGSFAGTSNFAIDWSGSDSHASAGSTDGFVTQVGSDGSYGWTIPFGDTGADAIYGIATGNATLYSVGSFSGTVDFANGFSGGDEHTSDGSTDAFVTRLTNAPSSFTITDAAGLTFEDENGTNLSSAGTSEPSLTVYVRDEGGDNPLLATVTADMTENRDWSGASGDTDLDENKMFLNAIIGAPGAGSSLTLYVPRETGDKAVTLCPGADALEDVTANCAGKLTYTDSDAGVDTITFESIEYWTIDGVDTADVGAMSVEFPGASITETDEDTVVTEDGATDYISVQLNAAPTDDVTVTITPSTGGRLLAITPLTFTSSDWDDPQMVLLEAVDNDTIDAANSLTLSYATASSDTNYDGTGESGVVTVGITDNDTAGVAWESIDLLTDETGDTAAVCLSLTSEPSENVTLELESADTGEITLSSGSLVIAPEDWDATDNCVTATGQDDSTTDGPQEVAISVTAVASSDANYSGLDVGGFPASTLTNQDDDTASVTVSTSDPAETTEAGDTAEICVELSAQPNSGSVTIPLSVSDAAEASLGEATLVVAAADWSQSDNCVTITGVDDDIDDGDVGFTVITGDPTAGDPVWDALDAGDVANPSYVNIDNDAAGLTIIESGGSSAVTEGGATDTVTVALDTQPASGNEVVVHVQPSAQLDIGGGAGVADTLTFTESDWGDTQTVTITAVDDASVEGNHGGSLTVTIDGATTEVPYLALDPEVVSAAITDNDVATVSIATVDDATENPASNGSFQVSLDSQNNTGGDITIGYSVGGTAVADTHYDALSGLVAIASGQSTATITIDVDEHNNILLEGDKTVVVSLTGSSSPNAEISGTDEATVVIFDDETAEASLSATVNGDEDGPVDIEYTVTLDTTNNTGNPISFDIDPMGGTATAGDDYTTFSGGTIEIADGQTTGNVTVTVTDDVLLEASTESVIATLSSPSLAAVSFAPDEDSVSATIADDDTAVIGVTATDDTAAENPASPGEFTIAIDRVNNTGGDITVTYSVGGTATADSDYDALSGSAIIPNGQSSVTVAVDTTGHNDSSQEGNETIIVSSLSTSLGGRVAVGDDPSAMVTIADDEGANVTVTATDDTTSETGETATICFELTSEPSADVTIALSSADVSKVTVPASITIDAANWNAPDNCVTATGQDDTPPVATGTQDVTIVTGEVTSGDSFYEALEGGDVEDVTIHHADDDTAGVEVQIVDGQTSESGGDSATVQFRLTSQPSSSVTIPLTISDTTEGSLSGVSELVIAPEDWDDYSASEVIIEGVDDDLTDGDINYQLVTGDPTSGDGLYNAVAANDVSNPTLSNVDDDEASVAILATDGTTEVTEGGVTDVQTVQIGTQPAIGNEVVITATPSSSEIDLGSGAGAAVSLTFTGADWDEAQTITVTAVDDAVLEADHSAVVTYAIDTDQTTEPAYDSYATALPILPVDITDNDTATADLSASNGDEDGPSDLGFTVTLSKENNTGSPITFDLDPTGGTATVIDDYDDFSGTTLSVPDGATTASVDVAVVDDALLENGETVVATVTTPSLGAVTISTASDTATIADNDTASVTVAATDTAAAENPSDNGEFTISLDKTNYTGSSITVNYTVSGSATEDQDYTALTGSRVIANGQAAATITVDTTGHDDALIEGDETVIVTLDDTSHGRVSVGNPDDATVTVADEDEPSVTVTATSGSTEVTEGGATDIQAVQIGTQPAPGNEVVITVEPEDAQLDLGSGAGNAVTLTFTNANWEEPQEITVTAQDDALLESDHASAVTYSIDANQTSESAYDSYGPIPELAVSITDNDTATASLSAANGSETGPNDVRYTVTLSKENNTGAPITFTLNDADGSANVGDDYTAFDAATISIADGQTTDIFDVEVIDDAILEGDETLEAEISDPSLGTVTIAVATDTATITDNDTTVVVVNAIDGTATENPSTNATFEVSLGRTNHSASPITVEYTVSGTATAGSDYAVLSGTASIASGQYATTVTVDTAGMNDDSVEGSESVIITLDSVSHPLVSIGSPDSASVTIIDDDAPSVTITATGGSTNVAEGGATDTQAIEIGTQPAVDTQVVIVATPQNSQIDLGAGAGNPVERTFTDANWSEAQTVTITAVDDTLLETTHGSGVVYTLDLDQTDDTDYLNYEDSLPTLPVTITDNDTATVSLSVENGAETGPTDIEFTATLSKENNTGSPITVVLNPTGGNATVTDDYANFSSTTISIPSGDSSGIASIGVVDDSLLEGEEAVEGTISTPNLGAVSVATAAATATIVDNDQADVTIVATDPTAAENPSSNGEFTFYLSRVNNTGNPITIDYSVGGTATASQDYSPLAGSVSIASGESTAAITVDTTGLNDDTVEESETVIVTLVGSDHPLVSVGNPESATVTIADDDSFTMNVSLLQDGDETGPETAMYIVELSHPNTTGSDITATVADSGDGTAQSGDDYEPFGGTISIPDGQQSTTFSVTVIDDDDLEGLESLEAVLSNPSEGEIGIATATATITDNDTAVATIVASDAEATEDPSDNGTFTISLDKPNGRNDPVEFTYSINGTATGGADYDLLSGNAMIASGQSATTITVNTAGYNDDAYEGSETVIVTLTSSSIGVVTIGDPSQATLTISDDDPELKAPVTNTDTSAPRPVTRIVTVPTNPDAPAEESVQSPVEPKPQPVDQVKKDLDGDSILDEEEKRAHNRGDGNGDGIPDTKQENVGSLLSPVSKKPVTLEVWGECTKIQKFAIITEDKLEKQDKRYRYPYGLLDYALACDKAGQQAHVTVYYDKQYQDVAQWRKFTGGEQFAELQSLQSLAQPIGDRDVSTVQYSLRDGGANDDDGKADGRILDPAGPALRTFYFWDVGWIAPVLVGGFFIGRSLHHRFRDHGFYRR